MTFDRLEDRAAIADQMFRYARATDWLETDRHREVFVTDCVFDAAVKLAVAGPLAWTTHVPTPVGLNIAPLTGFMTGMRIDSPAQFREDHSWHLFVRLWASDTPELKMYRD